MKKKKTLALLAAAAMCSTTLLYYPAGIFAAPLPTAAAQEDVEINAANFPDATFRTYVDETFDTTDDNILTAEEIAAVTEIEFYLAGITTVSDLTGVAYFTALDYLDCSCNQLTSLDVSKNTALTTLYCENNQLTSLDVSKNTALTYLNCSSNQLTSLDVSKNTALLTLYCKNNQLTSLDVSGDTALTYLDCSSNQLTSLDVSGDTALTYLNCSSNQLTSLDVSKNTALTALDCYNTPLLAVNGVSPSITNFDADPLYVYLALASSVTLSDHGMVEGNISDLTNASIVDGAIVPTALPAEVTYTYDVDGENGDKTIACTMQFGIDVNETNFPDETFRTYVDEKFDTTNDDILTAEEIAAVTEINVYNKGIADLKGVEYFTALKNLTCSNNNLTSLDLSNNIALEYLSCQNNNLTSLDVSNTTQLFTLDCFSNSLASLDVSGCPDLSNLNCSLNLLTNLGLSTQNCTKII